MEFEGTQDDLLKESTVDFKEDNGPIFSDIEIVPAPSLVEGAVDPSVTIESSVCKELNSSGPQSNVNSPPLGETRETKPSSKQKYPGTVSCAEINLMRLSAKTCRSANALLPREPFVSSIPLWASPPLGHHGSAHGWQKKKMVNGFCVRNCERLHLIPELGLPNKLLQGPGPFCTDAELHMNRLKTTQLAQACPTCWSSQRHR